MIKDRWTIKITGAALCSAISAVLGCFPPIYLTPWFMRIDLVAVPWIVCWIVFGFKTGLLSALVSIPIVGFFEPFAGGWVGGIMKFVASVWMFTIPALFAKGVGGERKLLAKKRLFSIASAAAIIVRALVCVVFNFYFALPIFFPNWFKKPEDIITFYTLFRSPVGAWIGAVGLAAFVFEVTFWNSIQGLIDLFASWLIGLAVVRRIGPPPK